jgi:tRNA modification GTPase
MSTIAAISTAPAIGGIGIVRMSGKDCFEVLEKIFKPKNPETIENIAGYRIKYGTIVNPETNRVVDEVLVSYFKCPKSYTAENMCEINSHGGIVVLREILELCLKNGAELAKPGEFTERAFLNGRIDLTQAEAIIDIINAKSTREAQESANQLEGYLSRKINEIREKIMDIMVNIEANIDYPEYDVVEVSNKDAENKLKEIENELIKLSKTFENGKILKEGVKIAIIGSPNAGKSSLLNSMLKEERAIVTDIAGTTRDIIEEQISIEGIPFKVIDTAGIRDAKDKIEQIGIEKSKKAANEADVILAVFDSSVPLNDEDREILNLLKHKKSIIVLNKTDLKQIVNNECKEIQDVNTEVINISLKNNEGLEKIYESLVKMFNLNQINLDNELTITNIRHQELINKAIESTRMALNDLNNSMPIDIISINIKEILEHLGEITGDNVSEDIIKSIFAKFCLGK